MDLGAGNASRFSLPTWLLWIYSRRFQRWGRPASSPALWTALLGPASHSLPHPPEQPRHLIHDAPSARGFGSAAPLPLCHSLGWDPASFPPPHLMGTWLASQPRSGVRSLVPSQAGFPLLGRSAHGASAITHLPPHSFSLLGPPPWVHLPECCQALLTPFLAPNRT